MPATHRHRGRTVLFAAALALLGTAASAAETRNLAVDKKTSAGERRIALVIGNAAYRDSPLANPVNDARAVARALRQVGFAVTQRENTTLKEMQEAVRHFGDALRAGGVGLFYFAGHGMQVKGRNYLIPVGADIEREDEVAYNALDANLVLEKMETARNRVNIVILDACRNNPFARSFRSAARGLVPMEAPVGTLVAFATAPGSVASDGAGHNGLYTQHLLAAMTLPGAKIEDVFKRVRQGVRAASGGKQVPWENTSLEGDFYFTPPAPATAGAAAELSIELAYWESIKESRNPDDYQAYLRRFPNGQFAELARARAGGSAAGMTPTVVAAAKPPAPMTLTPDAPLTALAGAQVLDLPAELREALAQSGRSSEGLRLLAPEVAENGAVVPVSVHLARPLVRGETLYVVVEDRYLAHALRPTGSSAVASFSTRVKMTGSGDIAMVVVGADGVARVARQRIRVMVGAGGAPERLREATDEPEIRVRRRETSAEYGTVQEVMVLATSPSSVNDHLRRIDFRSAQGGVELSVTPAVSMNPVIAVGLAGAEARNVRVTATTSHNREAVARVE